VIGCRGVLGLVPQPLCMKFRSTPKSELVFTMLQNAGIGVKGEIGSDPARAETAANIPTVSGKSALRMGPRRVVCDTRAAMTYLYKDRDGQSVQFLPLNNLSFVVGRSML
jgi:hypothetical protein